MKEYNHLKIEPKWRKIWAKTGINKTQEKSSQPKFYILDMFPYPSGVGLHVGHPRGYIATDIYSRFIKMNGYNVLHPMGWDAFGLPSENYAIKNKISPIVATKTNIKRFKEQISIMGLNYDWSREINTTDPAYYKWTQWAFLQMFKKGLAYESNEPINWCPSCKTGLANEDLEDGHCERCGTLIEKKPLRQWVIRMTDYADRLLEDLNGLDWAENIKESQRNWIGRSEGAEISFPISVIPAKAGIQNGTKLDSRLHGNDNGGMITVFTTRPDTLFGVTYVVLAPENKLVDELRSEIRNWSEVEKYRDFVKAKTEIERTAADKNKTGVELKGVKAINPANNEEVPIFVADYVLNNYGTGAVMAVPAHDERDFAFAKKYDLPIKEVIIPERIDKRNPPVAGKEKVVRQNVHVIVKNPKTGLYVGLKYNKHNWTTFPMGGVDKGEDIIAAAKRELFEETGYKNVTGGKILGGQVRAEYFAAHKDQNRVSYTNAVYFELVNEEKEEIGEAEKEEHQVIWLTEKDIHSDLMTHAEMDVWLERLAGKIAYTGDGIMIKSGKFSDLDNQKAKKGITEAFGREKVSYKLKDWVFSRQRYWGEPFPLVHCGKCAIKKYDKEAKIALNFYYADVWEALKDGTKTLETRALNPEEKDRYFGDVKVGDILKFSYRDKKSKKLKDEKLFRVKSRIVYKNFEELFADKVALSKLHKKNYKNVAELEKSYAAFGKENLDRIFKHGLVAWDVEQVTVAVPVPEKDLPVKLPDVKFYEPTGTGESPLAAIAKWVNVKCPVCKGPAKRETNTMPQWAGSSWYYLRYIDPKNKKALVDKKKEKYWSPVDLYVGGGEHNTRHLIYARFWHKFLYDIGVVNYKEPFTKLKNLGMILGTDGRKMSKRWGNVINPDDVVRDVGADTLRVYESFMGPFDQEIAWSTDNMVGSRRFLDRVWRLQNRVIISKEANKEFEVLLHRTIKKVTEDILNFSFNTAISAFMILTNAAEKTGITKSQYEILIKLLAPFAPHMTDEIWANLGHKKSIHLEKWPEFDEAKIVLENITIVVQINGKPRANFEIGINPKQEDVEKTAFSLPEVKKWLDGKNIRNKMFVKGKILIINTD